MAFQPFPLPFSWHLHHFHISHFSHLSFSFRFQQFSKFQLSNFCCEFNSHFQPSGRMSTCVSIPWRGVAGRGEVERLVNILDCHLPQSTSCWQFFDAAEKSAKFSSHFCLFFCLSVSVVVFVVFSLSSQFNWGCLCVGVALVHNYAWHFIQPVQGYLPGNKQSFSTWLGLLFFVTTGKRVEKRGREWECNFGISSAFKMCSTFSQITMQKSN